MVRCPRRNSDISSRAYNSHARTVLRLPAIARHRIAHAAAACGSAGTPACEAMTKRAGEHGAAHADERAANHIQRIVNAEVDPRVRYRGRERPPGDARR